ncbi:GAF domain-containing sensor histidine kinase [Leptolyngbya sp. FACHB-8]|nr:GAF domain-containing sensor histidine kinase [Leptolyngbya sp. FACHB-8]MBD1910413.1 GAF domain-containing sensor histidine kinase [Leptolyngbya sp. FACHB-8]MBD2154181.1 GAF domain-containing sensor histidine kinase [Leptolyngbya sp. FACHB-16]
MTSEQAAVTAPLYMTLSRAGIVLAATPTTAAHLGFATSHLIGMSFLDLLLHRDRLWLARSLEALDLEPVQSSVTLQHKDGFGLRVELALQAMQGLEDAETVLVALTPVHIPHDASVASVNSSEHHHRFVSQIAVEFSRHIRHSLDLHEILTAAVNQVQAILGADRVLICRIHDENAGTVLAEACPSAEFSILNQDSEYQQFPPECLQLYKQGISQVIGSIDESGESCPTCFLNNQVQAKLVVPILQRAEAQRGELWGLLVAQQCTTSRTWEAWEIDLISQLGGQLEIAVSQSELYQQVQRLNTELEDQIRLRMAQLQQAYDFEATLKRITDRVRDSLDEDQILQAAVRELATVTRVAGCNAAIYDLQKGTSTVRYEYTTTDLPYHGRVIQLDAFPEAYTTLLAGQPTQFCSLMPNPIRGTVATLAVPILDDKGVLGDLWLVNDKEYAFSEQDIRLVQQVANQCAIAIRQARLYQASMAQVRELERLNQLKDDFLSTVSHELRTPMSNVKMAIQMLEILLQQTGMMLGNEARIDRYLKILHEESQREINLITDLLDLSRLDSGADTVQIGTLDLSQWVPQRMRVFEEQARTHQQTLVVQCPPTLPVVTTDNSKLERILTELLTNAFKYTPSQETITLQVQDVQEDGRAIALRLSVTNTGVEIPQDEQERIFEKFYRIPNNDPWQYGGTGLGLALVKQMVHQLGGRLTLESGQNQTCFAFELPLYLRLNGKDENRPNAPVWPEVPPQSPLALPDR